MKVKLEDLKEYPYNKDVYGSGESDQAVAEMEDLMQSISMNGVLTPIIVDDEDQIIAGHRRVEACRALGFDEIPAEIMAFEDEMQKILYLFTSNKYRTKTTEMKAREAMFLKTAYSQYAETKRIKNRDPEYNLPDEMFREKVGRDALAKLVGLSGRTMDKAVKVVQAIDELEEMGEEDKAAELRSKLETNVSGAEQEVKEMKEPTGTRTSNRPDVGYDEDKYWYWKRIKECRDVLTRVNLHLTRKRQFNHTTPKDLSDLIKNLKNAANKLDAWNPENLHTCGICKGEATDPPCEFCINGETGAMIPEKIVKETSE